MKSFIKRSFSIMLVLCFMFVCFGLFGKTKVKADTVTYTLTITKDDFNTTSYAANNNEKTSDAVGSDSSSFEVKWSSNQIMQQSSAMQWQKSNGYIYNSTDLGHIVSVTVTKTDGTFTTYYGDSANPSSTTFGNGKGFFKVKVGSATGKVTSLVVVFAPLSTISVKTNPTKTTYSEGDYFDPTGLVITKNYCDGTTVDFPYAGNTEKFIFSPTLTTVLNSSNEFVEITVKEKSVNVAIIVNVGSKFTVTFDINGGDSGVIDPIDNITPGSKIVAPSPEPTKSGYNFLGWFIGDTETEWKFLTDVVTSDLNLKAHWIETEIANMIDDLNDIEAYLKLGYRYDGNYICDNLNKQFTGVESTNNYEDWDNKTSNSSAKYSGNSCGDNNAIQLRSNNNNSGIVQTVSGGKVKKIVIVWNSNTASGRTLNVYGKNTAYSAATDLYSNDEKISGELLGIIVKGTSTELTITGNYEYIGLRSASGAMYIDKIKVLYENTLSDVDFRLQCGVDDILELVGDGLMGVEVGIEVSAGGKTVKKALGDSTIHTDGDIKYIVIDLGDLLNNPERLDVEFTVRAYATYNATTYYTETPENVKTCSIVDMIEIYNGGTQDVKDAIAGLVVILSALGKLD